MKKKWGTNRRQLFFLALLGFIFIFIFCYVPMFGIVLAFKDGDYVMDIAKAMFETDWVGLESFKKFLTDPEFLNVVRNTLGLNILSLIFTFPLPIIFALFINEFQSNPYKKTIQTISYFPYFLSWVVFGGIVLAILDPQTGVLNGIMLKLGIIDKAINFGTAEYFWGLMIITAIIKGVGWGSIIYVAAISGVDSAIYESAELDGAGRFKKMWYITLPSISPTITVFLIMSISGILNSGFEQTWIFQNQMNLDTSEMIDTYVYKYGVLNMRYSYATAIGLLKSVLALILLWLGNRTSKKISGEGIF